MFGYGLMYSGPKENFGSGSKLWEEKYLRFLSTEHASDPKSSMPYSIMLNRSNGSGSDERKTYRFSDLKVAMEALWDFPYYKGTTERNVSVQFVASGMDGDRDAAKLAMQNRRYFSFPTGREISSVDYYNIKINDPKSDPKFPEKSDPDPKKIISDPQHCICIA